MHIIIVVVFVFLLIYGPSFWVKRTLKKYQKHREDFPGTGGQLARHLLDRFNLENVKVEETDGGDHYDPNDRAVRLSKENYGSKSLTAVAVAAHEVGHAIQHGTGYGPLLWRGKLVVLANVAEKMGVLILIVGPILTVLSRSPIIGVISVLAIVAMFVAGVVVHIVTLPVEFDASFKRALPILEQGEYLDKKDMKPARKILKAAALTYVSASLMSILNFARWLYVLRR